MPHEPLTTTLLLELIDDLQVAFPSSRNAKNPNTLADVYRNGLRGLSGDSVREAVGRCIQTEEFFPKVAKIRAIATAYDRQRTVSLVRISDDPEACPVCGARAVMHDVMREIGKDAKGIAILEFTGVTRDSITHNRRAHGLSEHDAEQYA